MIIELSIDAPADLIDALATWQEQGR